MTRAKSVPAIDGNLRDFLRCLSHRDATWGAQTRARSPKARWSEHHPRRTGSARHSLSHATVTILQRFHRNRWARSLLRDLRARIVHPNTLLRQHTHGVLGRSHRSHLRSRRRKLELLQLFELFLVRFLRFALPRDGADLRLGMRDHGSSRLRVRQRPSLPHARDVYEEQSDVVRLRSDGMRQL